MQLKDNLCGRKQTNQPFRSLSVFRFVQPCPMLINDFWFHSLVTSNVNPSLCNAFGRRTNENQMGKRGELYAVCQETGEIKTWLCNEVIERLLRHSMYKRNHRLNNVIARLPGRQCSRWIKQSFPKTKTIFPHIVEKVRTGTLDRDWKCLSHTFFSLHSFPECWENFFLLFQRIQPHLPQTGDGNMNLSGTHQMTGYF